MLKIRMSRDHPIFNMEIPIPGKDIVYIETGPWSFLLVHSKSCAYLGIVEWPYCVGKQY